MPSTSPDKDVAVETPHRADVATVTATAAKAKAKAARAKARAAKAKARAARAAAAMAARDLRLAVAYGVGALAAIAVGSAFGDIHGHALRPRLMALATATAFLVLAQFSIRSAANGLAKIVSVTGGKAAGMALRLITLVVGYLLMALILLGMLEVPIQHLVLGGALTGVIVGIAAQQSLGNVFAGMVLLMARVFRVGDRVRIRSGPLGGEVNGAISSVGLAYVVLDTEDGPLHVPNSAVLAAAVGPQPRGGHESRLAEHDQQHAGAGPHDSEPGPPAGARGQTSGGLRIP
jgi:small-conductance mechanosensitive channel